MLTNVIIYDKEAALILRKNQYFQILQENRLMD